MQILPYTTKMTETHTLISYLLSTVKWRYNMGSKIKKRIYPWWKRRKSKTQKRQLQNKKNKYGRLEWTRQSRRVAESMDGHHKQIFWRKQHTGKSGSSFLSKARHRTNTDHSFRSIGKSNGKERHSHRRKKYQLRN